MFNYYYSLLTPNGKIIYDALKNAIAAFQPSVTVKAAANQKDITDAISAVKSDNPYFFHLGDSFQYSLSSPCQIQIKYKYEKEEYEDKLRSLRYDIQSFKAAIPNLSQMNELHKSVSLHNILLKTVSYDYEAAAVQNSASDFGQYSDSFNAFGAIVRRKAVCEGFSCAFKMLCDECGIDCFIVKGEHINNDGSVGERHSWNMLRIGGKFTHVDTTWNAILSQKSDAYRFDYFGMTDKECMLERRYNGYPKATDESLNFFVGTNKLIKNATELKALLQKAIQDKPDKLYFKLQKSSALTPETISKLSSIIESYMGSILSSGGSYFCIHNKELNIFFFYLEYPSLPLKLRKKK